MKRDLKNMEGSKLDELIQSNLISSYRSEQLSMR